MVSEYYSKDITTFSEKELFSVLSTLKEDVCLIGGWAVYLHVNDRFRERERREYLGSVDIDLGIDLDPVLDHQRMRNGPLNEIFNKIENLLGYERSRFGFVKYFLRKNGEHISEEESKRYALFDIFSVFIDIIPDTEDLDVFKDVFGFQPPSEPLLRHAFHKGMSEDIGFFMKDHPFTGSRICDSELLAAMKIRSIPKRDREHKRVKDVCDLHALLWYSEDYTEMKERVKRISTEADLKTLREYIDDDTIKNASDLMGVEKRTLKGTITDLYSK